MMHRVCLIKSPSRGSLIEVRTLCVYSSTNGHRRGGIFLDSLFFVGVNDELFDIFGEHGQTLVFLRINGTASKLNMLRIDYHG